MFTMKVLFFYVVYVDFFLGVRPKCDIWNITLLRIEIKMKERERENDWKLGCARLDWVDRRHSMEKQKKTSIKTWGIKLVDLLMGPVFRAKELARCDFMGTRHYFVRKKCVESSWK